MIDWVKSVFRGIDVEPCKTDRQLTICYVFYIIDIFQQIF